jgi:hypothetical protein
MAAPLLAAPPSEYLAVDLQRRQRADVSRRDSQVASMHVAMAPMTHLGCDINLEHPV